MTDTDLEDTGLRAHEHLEWKKLLRERCQRDRERLWTYMRHFNHLAVLCLILNFLLIYS